MRSILKIALLLMVTIPVSCKRFANPFAGGDKVLAEVGGEKLYVHDLSSIFTPDMAPEDSVKIRLYVDRWVKMQLKIQEAEAHVREQPAGHRPYGRGIPQFAADS